MAKKEEDGGEDGDDEEGNMGDEVSTTGWGGGWVGV